MAAVFADLLTDIAGVVNDYRALDVPTVLRMRQASANGEHSLFSTRMRRMTAHLGQAMQRAQQLTIQPMDELAAQDLRLQAQRTMEIGFRILEVSSSDLAISTVTSMAERLGVAIRSVSRSLPEEATPAAVGSSTMLLSKTELLAGLNGLATDAPDIARRYRDTYADFVTGRSVAPTHELADVDAPR